MMYWPTNETDLQTVIILTMYAEVLHYSDFDMHKFWALFRILSAVEGLKMHFQPEVLSSLPLFLNKILKISEETEVHVTVQNQNECRVSRKRY